MFSAEVPHFSVRVEEGDVSKPMMALLRKLC